MVLEWHAAPLWLCRTHIGKNANIAFKRHVYVHPSSFRQRLVTFSILAHGDSGHGPHADMWAIKGRYSVLNSCCETNKD